MPDPRTVAIVLFDDVEVLDFAGPFEVFGVAGLRGGGAPPFRVLTVAERPGPVVARNGLTVTPHHTLDDCPPADLLVVPGGGGRRADGTPLGTRREMTNGRLLDWVRARDRESELTLSVCTGSLVLGAAGLLDGRRATTHHLAYDELRRVAPRAEVVEGVKMVDAGRVVTSGGISAGIDMSLAVVARLLGHDAAAETARYMEYDWGGARPGAPP
jgi:transcriptional regulator GlxA family with amidase domain